MKKLRFIFLALVPFLVLMVTACADDSDNGGSSSSVDTVGYKIVNGVWEIYNAYGLSNFRDAINNDNNSLNAILINDITLDNRTSWTPIADYGNNNVFYVGIFDGDNHTISGLYINDNQSDYQALFGAVGDNGSVKNLLIDNASILGNDNVSTISSFNLGTINNISVIGGTVSGNNNVGGIVAYNNGGVLSAGINSSNVKGSGMSIGGIIGNNSSVIFSSGNSSILIACYNTGNVSGSDRVGGIVGNNFFAFVTASYNMGNVVGVAADIGSVIGFNFGTHVISGNYYIKVDDAVNGVQNGIGNILQQGVTELDNVTSVDNMTVLNTKVASMNNAINKYVLGNSEIGHRYKEGSLATDSPVLYSEFTLIESVNLSYDKQSILVYEPISPTVSFYPQATTEKGIKYSIDNTSIATIDADTGVVTGVSVGTAKILATSTHNDVIFGEFDIDVRAPVDLCEDIYNPKGYIDTGIAWEVYNRYGLINLHDAVLQGQSPINVVLVCDIDLMGSESNQWKPVGTGYGAEYRIYVDGNYKTISNLYINTTDNNTGLFSTAVVQIKNATFKNANITGGVNIGIITGEANFGSTIDNVHIDNATINGVDKVGTLVGYGDEISIVGSTAKNVKLSASDDGARIGGLIGRLRLGSIAASYVDNATITAHGARSYVGGIIGYFHFHRLNAISGSFTNNVHMNYTDTSVAGGIGYCDGNLNSNYFVSNNLNIFGNANGNRNDNATPVSSLLEINSKVGKMNEAASSHYATVITSSKNYFFVVNEEPSMLPSLEYIADAGGGDDNGGNYIPVRQIFLQYRPQTISVGQTVHPIVYFLPDTVIYADVDFSTGYSELVTIDESGNITGVAPGQVEVTATLSSNSSISTTFTITVE